MKNSLIIIAAFVIGQVMQMLTAILICGFCVKTLIVSCAVCAITALLVLAGCSLSSLNTGKH